MEVKIIINWLKNKIRKWLGIEQLNDIIKYHAGYINGINHKIDNYDKTIKRDLQHNEDLIKSFLATCQTGYDLGVSQYHKNWCVFVRQGKGQDFVKFIDLSGMTIDDIKHFEKQLESTNRHRNEKYRMVDAPAGIKDYFRF